MNLPLINNTKYIVSYLHIKMNICFLLQSLVKFHNGYFATVLPSLTLLLEEDLNVSINKILSH